jgi:hypothetical protein
MPEHSKSICIAVPSGKATVRHCDPQIVMSILSDGLNEVAREPIRCPSMISVPKEPVSVVANQAIFRAEPDESLAVLQRGVDRALGQPVRGGEMLENSGRCLGSGRRSRLLHSHQAPEEDADQCHGSDARPGHVATLRECAVLGGDGRPNGKALVPHQT